MLMRRAEFVRLKQQINLLDLIGGELHKVAKSHGGEYAGPCPFCGGEDRFHVQPFAEGGGRWFCRQCTGEPTISGWRDGFDFLMRRDKLSFREAVATLYARSWRQSQPVQMVKAKPSPDWCSAMWQEKATAWLAQAVQRLADPRVGLAGRTYLQGRGFTPATWQAWGLGYGKAWHVRRARHEDALFLPWWTDGALQAIQYRYLAATLTKRERYGQKAGGERLLFGLPLLTGATTLILVEGELNAISLWQVCHGWGVDVLSWGPQGNLLRSAVLAAVAKVIQQGYQQVILWADEENITQEALTALCALGVTQPQFIAVFVPSGQDANDLLQQNRLESWVAKLLHH